MWEYKITKGSLGFHVFRRREEDGVEKVERLQTDTYTKLREHARTFYHLSDAESALVIAKYRAGKGIEGTSQPEKKECERKPEKISWAEL